MSRLVTYKDGPLDQRREYRPEEETSREETDRAGRVWHYAYTMTGVAYGFVRSRGQ